MSDDLRRKQAAEGLRAALARHDVSQAALADMCGCSRALVARWLNPDDRAFVRVHDLMAFPRPVVLDLLSQVGRGAGFAVAPHVGPGDLDHRERLATILKELSDVGTTYSYVTATHGGVITNSELEHLEREVREAQAALGELAAWIQEERGRRGMR